MYFRDCGLSLLINKHNHISGLIDVKFINTRINTRKISPLVSGYIWCRMSKNVKINIDFILRNIIVAGLVFKNMETKIRLEIKVMDVFMITMYLLLLIFSVQYFIIVIQSLRGEFIHMKHYYAYTFCISCIHIGRLRQVTVKTSLTIKQLT